MTVKELIEMLNKVEHKEAEIRLCDTDDSPNIYNECCGVVVEHYLSDDTIFVVLSV